MLSRHHYLILCNGFSIRVIEWKCGCGLYRTCQYVHFNRCIYIYICCCLFRKGEPACPPCPGLGRRHTLDADHGQLNQASSRRSVKQSFSKSGWKICQLIFCHLPNGVTNQLAIAELKKAQLPFLPWKGIYTTKRWYCKVNAGRCPRIPWHIRWGRCPADPVNIHGARCPPPSPAQMPPPPQPPQLSRLRSSSQGLKQLQNYWNRFLWRYTNRFEVGSWSRPTRTYWFAHYQPLGSPWGPSYKRLSGTGSEAAPFGCLSIQPPSIPWLGIPRIPCRLLLRIVCQEVQFTVGMPYDASNLRQHCLSNAWFLNWNVTPILKGISVL